MSFPTSRRQFLHAAAAAPLLSLHGLRADQPALPGQILRQRSPENLEMNFAGLNGFMTPTPAFYVRNHFAVPKIDLKAWRLKIDGAVERPVELSFDQLQRMASKATPTTLECAGNGRVFLTPPAKGVNWQLGAVGTAEWSGISLSQLLERAGVKKSAIEVVLEGADSGSIADPPSPGPIAFARSLPLDKARKPEVLLAWGMNGQDLPAAHGAPVRAVVGGWYGMASVKWLSRIHVVETPFRGFFQTLDYSYFERVDGQPSVLPITGIQVKSQIARPTLGEAVPVGQRYKVTGAAWAGEADVSRVEVSTDGGKRWSAAKMQGSPVPFCWRLWEFDWTPAVGPATLMSRATDSSGRTQPLERNPDYRNYMIHHVLPVEVVVR